MAFERWKLRKYWRHNMTSAVDKVSPKMSSFLNNFYLTESLPCLCLKFDWNWVRDNRVINKSARFVFFKSRCSVQLHPLVAFSGSTYLDVICCITRMMCHYSLNKYKTNTTIQIATWQFSLCIVFVFLSNQKNRDCPWQYEVRSRRSNQTASSGVVSQAARGSSDFA